LSILTKFFGRTASEGAAFAVGTAVGPTLIPAVRFLENEAWHAHPDMPLAARDAALAAAKDVAAGLDKADEAQKNGLDGERFAALVDIARAYPPLGELLQLRRRGIITEDELLTLLNRLGFTDTNAARLAALQVELLAPADLAMMRQQGFIDRPRQVEESAKQGVDAERADLLFEVSGLPPPTERAMEMLRRGIIQEPEFRQIVREGHEKTKYTDEELALRRELLSPATLVALHLKGWIDKADFHARMAHHGYDAGEADDWYDAAGRPAAPVQMYTAWARGAPGPYGGTFDKADFIRGIRQSDIRPEYGETLWHDRFNYPSLFQLRRAVQDGGISRARALTILRYERYEDTDAVALVDSWLTGTGTTAKGLTATDLANEYGALWITRAQYVSGLQQLGYAADVAAAKADAEDSKRARQARDALVARIHTLYVSHRLSRTAALDALGKASVPARVRDSLLPDWDVERDITADALTAAQIKKAFGQAMMPRAEAITRLEAKGYDLADANIYLDE
jgi:hypothetical protein